MHPSRILRIYVPYNGPTPTFGHIKCQKCLFAKYMPQKRKRFNCLISWGSQLYLLDFLKFLTNPEQTAQWEQHPYMAQLDSFLNGFEYALKSIWKNCAILNLSSSFISAFHFGKSNFRPFSHDTTDMHYKKYFSRIKSTPVFNI